MSYLQELARDVTMPYMNITLDAGAASSIGAIRYHVKILLSI